ncbi:MAG: peptide chain release factor N(5)-glutamine methyltransferase [Clostridiaceae bacterium]
MKNVGGQAVLEGVMMRGSHCVATSVRTPDGVIETLTEPIQYNSSAWRKTPVLRGVFSLVDSLATGLRMMNYAARFYEEPSTPRTGFAAFVDRISGGRGEQIENALTIGLSLGLALIFFTVLPTLLARFLIRPEGNRLALNLLEAVIKLVLFILYLLAISRIPDIRRVFKYHGAEHKVIDAYENDRELTVANVRQSSRYHARCGTNFMFLVLIMSIVVYSFVPSFDPFIRVVSKVLLIPVVAGLTFELILWLGANDTPLSRAISLPGRLMQRITTAEPDDAMIEVAITALKRSENLPFTIKELKAYADERLKGLEGAALDRDVLLSFVTGHDRSYLLAHPEATVTFSEYDRFRDVISKRRSHMPISYITGHKEFMRMDFIVNESTLIPRPDTEILVEEALLTLKSLPQTGEPVRILDLCSGSGAIGLSLAALYPNSRLVLADISPRAMAVARMNAQNLKVEDRTRFLVGDLFDAIDGSEEFHLIVSNPPYIRSREIRTLPRDVREFEPKQALDGGESGLQFYERISDKARQYITQGGVLFFEIGADQGTAVADLLRRFNWQDPQVIGDLAGQDRVVRATWIRDL